MGGSGSFLTKNEWEWVVFLAKWEGVGHFLENWWECMVFVKKWVGVGKSGLEWVRVAGSDLERSSVNPV